ncbi:hypothetical protein HHK36_029629 [Tetracentron sinense]|uniref:Uncharacterized protein n=1 Tax=Tetracentron sinense TaxID=13715 RepID=A0A834YDB1_TETSI|nr:hypothetical protein HHK36_029629 [Tetracentron sinense]
MIASFYQHAVVQRRIPLVGNGGSYLLFFIYIILQGKVGPFSSSIALAFKSWWKPSFTFSVSAVRDRTIGRTAFGFGVRIEDLRQARFNSTILRLNPPLIYFDLLTCSYQRADPNYVMLTPNKEHLAEGILWKIGKIPMLQSDIDSGNFDCLPRELRPIGKIL